MLISKLLLFLMDVSKIARLFAYSGCLSMIIQLLSKNGNARMHEFTLRDLTVLCNIVHPGTSTMYLDVLFSLFLVQLANSTCSTINIAINVQ